MTSNLTFHHDPDRRRISGMRDGLEIAFALVDPIGDTTYRIRHVEVMAVERNRGHAEALMRFMLDLARRQGCDVVPSCGYAAAFIRRHREYRDLLHNAA